MINICLLKYEISILTFKYYSLSFYTGDGSYGDKTVEDVAIDLIAASQQNLFRFETPRIVFAFFDGVTKTVAGE